MTNRLVFWGAFFLTLFALTGCGARYQAAKQIASEGVDQVAAEKRDISADALVKANSYICRTARIEGIIDMYARDEALWEAWLKLCGYDGGVPSRPQPLQDD